MTTVIAASRKALCEATQLLAEPAHGSQLLKHLMCMTVLLLCLPEPGIRAAAAAAAVFGVMYHR